MAKLGGDLTPCACCALMEAQFLAGGPNAHGREKLGPARVGRAFSSAVGLECPMGWLRKRKPSQRVTFLVTYDDGRTVTIELDRQALRGGEGAISLAVREQQARGSLPAGVPISAKRIYEGASSSPP